MGDIYSPRHYFLQVVLPAYEELGKTLLDGVTGNRRDLIAAGRAAEACLHLADHIASDPAYKGAIPGAPKSKEYIKHLTEKYHDFSITKDIANSFKHRRISDGQRRIEGIESLLERWALIRFTDSAGHYWATRKVVIVRLKGGVEIFVEDVVERCIAVWVQELLRLGVISSTPQIQLTPKRFLARVDVPVKPCIEMRAEQGEYFESQPVILSYDNHRDMFQPIQGKIGSVDIDVKMIVSPSRFPN
ncbi:MAG: hypothetical protein ACREPQ_04615 [Rhodanobacter sp.]